MTVRVGHGLLRLYYRFNLLSGNLASAPLQISPGGKVKRSRVMLENAVCLLKENSESSVIFLHG